MMLNYVKTAVNSKSTKQALEVTTPSGMILSQKSILDSQDEDEDGDSSSSSEDGGSTPPTSQRLPIVVAEPEPLPPAAIVSKKRPYKKRVKDISEFITPEFIKNLPTSIEYAPNENQGPVGNAQANDAKEGDKI
jgi:hypothetical protein